MSTNNLWQWEEYLKINYGSYYIIALKRGNNYKIVSKSNTGGVNELATVYDGKLKILKPKSTRVKMLLHTRKITDFFRKIESIAMVNAVILM